MIWLLALTACQPQLPEFITLSGVVSADHFEASAPLEGVEVASHDAGLELVDTATTNLAGFFALQARAGQNLFLGLEAEGYVHTAFAGVTGLSDAEFPEGQLWLESEEDVAELRALFDGCPGLDAGADAGLIEGEVRFYAPGYEPDEGSEWPIADTAYVRAYNADGDVFEACYLNETGDAYDELEVYTGASGRFAIFDAPTGAVTLEVGYDIEGTPYYQAIYFIWVPEGGAAPFWPMYVNLPGT